MSGTFQQRKEALLKQRDDLMLPIWWESYFLYKDFSTRCLTGFYEPEELRRILPALAALDHIYYYDDLPRWAFSRLDDGIECWCNRSLSGDDFEILMGPKGIVIKGFDHESEMSPYRDRSHSTWPGIYEDFPLELFPYLDVFSLEERINTTFCIWRLSDDICWQVGKIEYPCEDMDDGSGYFLGHMLDTSAEEWDAYYRFRDYDEEAQERAFVAVQYVFDTLTISEQIARDINPEVDFAAIREKLIEMGIRVTDELLYVWYEGDRGQYYR